MRYNFVMEFINPAEILVEPIAKSTATARLIIELLLQLITIQHHLINY